MAGLTNRPRGSLGLESSESTPPAAQAGSTARQGLNVGEEGATPLNGAQTGAVDPNQVFKDIMAQHNAGWQQQQNLINAQQGAAARKNAAVAGRMGGGAGSLMMAGQRQANIQGQQVMNQAQAQHQGVGRELSLTWLDKQLAEKNRQEGRRWQVEDQNTAHTQAMERDTLANTHAMGLQTNAQTHQTNIIGGTSGGEAPTNPTPAPAAPTGPAPGGVQTNPTTGLSTGAVVQGNQNVKFTSSPFTLGRDKKTYEMAMPDGGIKKLPKGDVDAIQDNAFKLMGWAKNGPNGPKPGAWDAAKRWILQNYDPKVHGKAGSSARLKEFLISQGF